MNDALTALGILTFSVFGFAVIFTALQIFVVQLSRHERFRNAIKNDIENGMAFGIGFTILLSLIWTGVTMYVHFFG